MTLYPNLIIDALRGVRYPGNGKSIVELGMIADNMRIDGMKVSFGLVFDKSTDPFIRSLIKTAEAAIHTNVSPDVEVTITPEFKRDVEQKVNPLPKVKNIIGVSSGKGGVGKSTVASNLAVALAAAGYKVGLLDADIFGPSMPKMFGVEDEPIYMINEEGRDWIEPIEKYGVKLLSIGFMVDKNKPVLWRGGMASNALKQLITDAWWGELDYFLIDMPPGTSDIHLTLVQTLPLTGVVVVTTPQEVALADARKGIAMFQQEQVNVPVLGLVENMAWFTPGAHPDEKYYIFGKDGGLRLAEETGTQLLGQIPLVESVMANADAGTPAALGTTPEATAYRALAARVAEAVAARNATLPPTRKVEMHS